MGRHFLGILKNIFLRDRVNIITFLSIVRSIKFRLIIFRVPGQIQEFENFENFKN